MTRIASDQVALTNDGLCCCEARRRNNWLKNLWLRMRPLRHVVRGEIEYAKDGRGFHPLFEVEPLAGKGPFRVTEWIAKRRRFYPTRKIMPREANLLKCSNALMRLGEPHGNHRLGHPWDGATRLFDPVYIYREKRK